jgi:hypothetical protein
MGMNVDQLKGLYNRSRDYLKSLEEQESHFVERTNGAFGVVRWLSDTVSGSKKIKVKFNSEITNAREALHQAHQLLQSKNLDAAALALKNTERHTKNASRFWRKYMAGTSGGAKNITTGLGVTGIVGVAAALGGGAPGLVVSSDLHVSGFIILEGFREKPYELPLADQRLDQSVAIAKDFLKKKNPTLPFDYGPFFLQVDNVEELNFPKHLLVDRERHLAQSKQIAAQAGPSPEEKARAVKHHHFVNYLTHYKRFQATYTGVLKREGANCEADTISSLDTLTTAVPLKHPLYYGVQVYSDHQQPVIYNKKTETLLNLRPRPDEIQDDTYHHPILLYAFLTGLGEDSPVTSNDLLLAKATTSPSPLAGEGRGEGVNGGLFLTNSNLTFPHAHRPFNTGLVPEEAYLRSPYGVTSTADKREETDLKVFVLEDLTDPRDIELGQIKFLKEWKDFGFYLSYRLPSLGVGKPGLIFRSRAERDFYNALNSEDEERDFLIFLMKRNLSHILSDSKSFENLLALISHPEKLKDQASSESDKSEKLLRKLANGITMSLYDIGYLHPNEIWVDMNKLRGHLYHHLVKKNSREIVIYKAETMYVRSRLPELHPLLPSLGEKWKQFEDQLKRDPERFLRLISQLPDDKNISLLNMISYLMFLFYQEDSVKPLLAIASDPKRVRVAEKSADPQGTIEIEIKGGEKFLKASTEMPKERQEEKVPERIIKLSPNAMANLVYLFGEDHIDLNKRWDPKMSEWFKKENRSGKRDGQFLEIYKQLVKARPTTNLTHPDPFDPSQKVPQDIFEILVEIKKRKENQPTRLRTVIVTPEKTSP